MHRQLRPILLGATIFIIAAVVAVVVLSNRSASAESENSGTPAAACSTAKLPLPDPKCTPGARNPDVTQATINSTICVSGWTKTVRPSTAYTTKLKQEQIVAYGYRNTNTADYEEDHFLPLELGGAPKDPKNLWPEPHYGNDTADDKDRVENAVKRAVCDGRTTLDKAQNAVLADWTTALHVLGIG